MEELVLILVALVTDSLEDLIKDYVMVDNTTVFMEIPLVSCMEDMDHTEDHMEV